jgi:phosphinothricin acetyltransferase
MSVVIRPAAPEDLSAITDIYAHHVVSGTGTFDEVAPTLDEITDRYRALTESGWPYLVAESEGETVGFCYAGPFRFRTAYRFTVEDSVYVHPAMVGRGIGKSLLTGLIDSAAALGFRRMISVIGNGTNPASIGLHRSCGFVESGRLKNVGYKHDQWLDVLLMQRDLGTDVLAPPLAEPRAAI